MSLLPPPFCSPRLSTDVAKWTQLANQPASTVGLLCEWVGCLDFSRFRFTRLFYQCSARGWLVGNNRLPIHITHPNIVLICHHECSGPQFCQVSHPKYVCRLKHRQFVSWSVEKRVCFSSPVQWISPLYTFPLLLFFHLKCLLGFHFFPYRICLASTSGSEIIELFLLAWLKKCR